MEIDKKRPNCPVLDVDGVISGGKQFDLDITLPEDLFFQLPVLSVLPQRILPTPNASGDLQTLLLQTQNVQLLLQKYA